MMTQTAAVWTDRGIFQARHEKSAAALVAVQAALRGASPSRPAVTEFLRLYRFCAELPTATFTRIWCDPGAYFWARTAYDLLGQQRQGGALSEFGTRYLRALGGDDPAAQFDAHLQQFARFALAAAALSGRTLRLTQPYKTRLPMSLPGTEYHLSGEGPNGDGEVRLLGWAKAGLLIADTVGMPRSLRLRAGEQAAGACVVEEPILPLGTRRLRLTSAPFVLPGADFAESIADSDAAFHRRHRPALHAALETVKRYHPQTYAQMVESMQLIALKRYEAGGFTNLSHSDLPGAFIISAVDNAHELADTLIHEFYHNRLFFLEERAPFFSDAAQNAAADGGHYSPWRDDLRPLVGLLHAVYVHTPVTEYWLHVLSSGGLSKSVREFATDRLIRYPVQLAMGLHQLRRYGHFATAGELLMEELEERLADLRQRIAQVLPVQDAPAYACQGGGGILERERDRGTGAPLSVLEVLDAHRRRSDTAGQLRGIPLARFAAA